MLANYYGLPVDFTGPGVGEASGAGMGDSKTLVLCVGLQLVSGKARWPSANGFLSGEVVAFCETSDRYTARLDSGVMVLASLQELRQHWDNRPRAGPYADGKVCAALQRSVLEIRAYRERQARRREPSRRLRPHQPTEW